ncbi:BMP family ABC transporter substrate-binding protein [Mycoplasmoides pirum]|uniref:BMP family ABC transporter substrate-binding protein n=1 Tax=Mycoplasmoides pirum TaxID=2122 RepID=UPI000698DA58|nr:BMP family ABC transporter substrate-binding protein [Mycoplasmoides pirum]
MDNKNSRSNLSKPIKNNKKRTVFKISAFSGLALSGVVVATIVTACSGVQFKSTAQVVVSDSSSVLADQSFSESTYDGLRDFYKALGQNAPDANSPDIVEGNGIWKKPGSNDDSRINTYENVKNDGSNIVIATGFNQQNALQILTDQSSQYYNTLKDTGFIFVDGAMSTSYGNNKTSNPTNVASIAYRADNGSFLVGLATAVYLNQNWSSFYSARPDTIGASGFVGIPLPSTVSLLNGYRQGLIYWNKIAPMIQLEDGSNGIPIKWISQSDDRSINSYSSGSFDLNSQAAITLMDKLITNGAKAIFPIAGPQTRIAVNSVTQKGENVAIIGVDTAQENITSLQKSMPKPTNTVKNVIPFSSLKNLKISVHGVLDAIKSGQNKGLTEDQPGYSGFGYNNVADLNNDGVGISDAGLPYLIDPLFFTENPTGSTTGKIDGTQVTVNNKQYQQYDLSSSTTTKWKLSDIKKGQDVLNRPTDGDKMNNYEKLLKDKILIKYSNDTTHTNGYNWTIKGDELSDTNSLDLTNLPAITGDNGKYTVQAAFGGEKTVKIYTGDNPLDGTKWNYGISII